MVAVYEFLNRSRDLKTYPYETLIDRRNHELVVHGIAPSFRTSGYLWCTDWTEGFAALCKYASSKSGASVYDMHRRYHVPLWRSSFNAVALTGKIVPMALTIRLHRDFD